MNIKNYNRDKHLTFLIINDTTVRILYLNCDYDQICIVAEQICEKTGREYDAGLKTFVSYTDFEEYVIKYDYNSSAGIILCKIMERYCIVCFIPDPCSKAAYFMLRAMDGFDEEDGEYDYASDADINTIVNKFNDTGNESLPMDKTIIDLFDEQVRIRPDHAAVCFGKQQLTYLELDRQSDRIVSSLLAAGVVPGDFVVISCRRSIGMIVVIMAVLKAGGVYVPVDPEFPQARIDYIIADCAAKAVLTYQTEVSTDRDVTLLKLDDLDTSDYADQTNNVTNAVQRHACRPKADDLAYCIYTSGTTGNPKGVLIRHQSLAHYVLQFCQYFAIDESAAVLQQAYIGFDTSIEEIYPALISGGKVVIFDMASSFDLSLLKQCVDENGITLISCSPLLLNELNKMTLDSVKVYISGGDIMKYEYADKLIDQAAVYNTYGPTEGTVCASYHQLSSAYESPVSIGKPISNTRIYITNGRHICGIGMCGELCIAGIGLAHGYLNRRQLTEEKFNADIRFEDRLYHTGDLARWTPDGSLEYLGRIDEQVKIRGYRIELAEIEKALCRMEEIEDAAVIVKTGTGGESFICAFITADTVCESADIRQSLTERLPAYMIPAYIVQIESMPVTANGKIDKKYLSGFAITTEREYVAALDETEKKVAELYSAILEIPLVGRFDHFFELGGHSLKAARLINSIDEYFHVRLPFGQVIKNPVVSEIAGLIRMGGQDKTDVIPPAGEKDRYPLSPAQSNIYFLSELAKDSTAYNIFEKIELEGKIDIAKMKHAFSRLPEVHDALRISFEEHNGLPVQKMREQADIRLEYRAVTSHEAAERMAKEFIRPFELQSYPLIRGLLLQFAADRYYLVIDTHHIISDGLSIEILLADLAVLYSGGTAEKSPVSYLDYCEWSVGRDLGRQQAYWLGQYDSEPAYCEIPTDFKRPARQSFKGKTIQAEIDKELKKDIQKIIKKYAVTEYMFFMSALSMLISFYSREEDIVVGSPFAGRIHPSFDRICGMFVNSVAVRTQPDPQSMYAEFLLQVKKSCLEAYEHQEYPFEELVAATVKQRDWSRNPIFGIMLAVQNFEQAQVWFDGVRVKRFITSENEMSQFDLSMDITSWEDIYCISLEYCTALYREDSMQYVLKHFIALIRAIIAGPEQPVGSYCCVEESELPVLLGEPLRLELDATETVVERFEKIAAGASGQIAVRFLDEAITYEELNGKANAIAYELIARGIGQEDIVAMIPERGIAMICVIWGILKAGAAYVPIDISYPEDRIRYIYDDSKAKCLITVGRQQASPAADIHIDDYQAIAVQKDNPGIMIRPDHLAYVIYTSGTTGNPKGVAVEQRNLLNLVDAYTHIYEMTPKDTVLQFASIAFDQSVWDIFNILLLGGTLCLIPYDLIGNIREFETYLNQQKVTVAVFTPAYLREIHPGNLPLLRMIESGGAEAEKAVLDTWRRAGKRVYNTYGPTEATVNALTFRYDRECGERLPIGRPIHNVSAYVLVGNTLCGLGMPGELCIGGAGVARGYLNRPELTGAKFVADPFREGKMYRTGDLVRMLPDGNIDYLGRIDEQVKVRGFRIELGEVENILRQQMGVDDAIALVCPDRTGDNCLCGYVTGQTVLDGKAIKAGLRKSVPEYMVPTFILQIERIPLTKNGKVDKKALPIPKDDERTVVTRRSTPRTKEEQTVAGIFAEVLGAEAVGPEDDFFDLGGHSLKAIKIINLLEQRMRIRLSLAEVLLHTTVADLAECCARKQETKADATIVKTASAPIYPVSPAQRRIYTTCLIEGNSTVYNMPEAIGIAGEIHKERLTEAFTELVKRHDILRTAYLMADDQPMAQIIPFDELKTVTVNFYESTEKEIEKLFGEMIREFDLSAPPLIRLSAVRTKADQWYLCIDLHHIAADGISLGIIWRQLADLYNRRPVAPAEIQYADYSRWLCGQEERFKRLQEYWVHQFDDEIPVLNLLEDYQRPKIRSTEGGRVAIRMEADIVAGITALAHARGATEYMIFLAALYILLAHYSRQDDIVIGTVVAGRENAGLDNMVGMFVNTIALRAQPQGDKNCGAFIDEVREICLKGIENQDFPYETLIDLVDTDRNMARNPLFDVMLVQQDQEPADIELDGVKARMDLFDEKVRASHDLVFNIIPQDTGIDIKVEYCSAIYTEDTVRYLAVHYRELVRNMTTGYQNAIRELRYFDDREEERLIYGFNQTQMDFPAHETFFGLFERQVRETPDNMALVGENERLTYQELNMRANTIAYELRLLGVRRNEFVAIVAGRSVEMIIALLGVMKAGAAYVPIDPEYPGERIRFIIDDCRPRVILSLHDRISHETIPVMNLSAARWRAKTIANPERVNTSDDLAYCIYTSGTTGQPKGVLIAHRGVANMLCSFRNDFKVRPGVDRVLQFANVSFDGSVWEYCLALFSGATLYIPGNHIILDAGLMAEYVKENQISVSFFPPIYYLQSDIRLSRLLITAGAAAERSAIAHGLQYCDYINAYGPTEGTVTASHWRCAKGSEVPGILSIGKPEHNKQIYIMNDLRLCGIGVPGELCIAGEGVAVGYLNQPELTREKFIDNPFGQGKLYRSGDLAKWLPDGNIVYLGRIDEQVKIRGFRIELGGIESVIRKVPGIKECAVIAREDAVGDKAIFAYYAADEEIDLAALKRLIREELPEYMLPAGMMQIPALPLTANGKLDRKALPEIRIVSTREYVEPSTSEEKMLCAVLAEVLGVERVGLLDNFYEFGGDSIKAIRIAARFADSGLQLSVKDILTESTVSGLAGGIRRAGRQYAQEAYVGVVRPTPVIHEFLTEWKIKDPDYFCQAVMVRAGTLSPEALRAAADKLLIHHDMLRAVCQNNIIEISGPMTDETVRDCQCPLLQFTLTDQEDKQSYIYQKTKAIMAEIKISRGPLMVMAVFQDEQEDHLFIAVHHLAIDAVSWQIVLEDLTNGYRQYQKSGQIALPGKTASFALWTETLHEYAQSPEFSAAAQYWLQEAGHLRRYCPEVSGNADRVMELSAELDERTTALLSGKANESYNTAMEELLLAALSAAAEKYGMAGVSVMVETHGREGDDLDLSVVRTVGWFTSTFAMVVPAEDTPENIIIHTKEKYRTAKKYHLAYGLCKMLGTGDPGPIPLFGFNYLGEEDDLTPDSMFTPSPYRHGDEIAATNLIGSPHTFTISIQNNKLKIELSSHVSGDNEGVVRALLDCYLERLREIITLCARSDKKQKTFTDFASDDFGTDDIDAINELIGIL